jgi:hypothetical protein
VDAVWIGLADLVLGVHLAYVAFIPLGGFVVLRYRRVVWIHLAAVALGLVSITVGFDCPLTSWEQSLRRRGGQHPYTNGFVDHYLKGHLYPHGYDSAVQAVCALCIVASYVLLAAQRRRGRRRSTAT